MRKARILLFGQAGVGKATVADALAAYLFPRPHTNVIVVDFDAALQKHVPREREFFDLDRATQGQIWMDTWARLNGEFQATDAAVIVYISGHYHVANETFSVARFSAFEEFMPSAIVTLIDDVYDCLRRLAGRTRTLCTLAQAVSWRSLEIEQAKRAAEYVSRATNGRLRASVVAVKHATRILGEAVEPSGTPLVYLSFPISHTRRNPAFLAELQTHRAAAHRIAPAFDPVTVDERRFLPSKDEEPTGLASRWPIEPLVPMVNTIADSSWPSEELIAAKPFIVGQLRSRAVQYVAQSDVIAVYRPTWNSDTIHRGVLNELRMAVALSKRTVVYDPEGRMSDWIPSGVEVIAEADRFYSLFRR